MPGQLVQYCAGNDAAGSRRLHVVERGRCVSLYSGSLRWDSGSSRREMQRPRGLRSVLQRRSVDFTYCVVQVLDGSFVLVGEDRDIEVGAKLNIFSGHVVTVY